MTTVPLKEAASGSATTHYLMINVLASGFQVNTHQILAIGACVVSSATGAVLEPRVKHTLRIIQEFVRPAAPPYTSGETLSEKWDCQSLNSFWYNPAKATSSDGMPMDMLRRLAAQYKSQTDYDVYRAFAAWCRQVAQAVPNLCVMTDSSFTTSWLQNMIDRISFGLPINAFGNDVPQSLNYLTRTYQPIFDANSYLLGVAGLAPEDGPANADTSVLAALGRSSGDWPAAILAVPTDRDPLHVAEAAAMKVAYVAGQLRKIRATTTTGYRRRRARKGRL